MSFPLVFNTPSNVAQCQDVSLLWSGGSPGTYSVTVVSAQNANGGVLGAIGSTMNTHIDGIVSIPANTLIKFMVTDSKGQSATTNLIAVGPSDDQSCLPASEQTSASSSPPAPGTASKSPPANSPSDTKTTGTTQSSDNAQQSTSQHSTGTTSASVSGQTVSSSGTGSGTISGSQSIVSPSAIGGVTNPQAGVDGTFTSQPSSQTSGAAPHASSSALSPAVFAGVGAGAIVLILVIAAIFLCRKRRGNRNREAADDWFNVPSHATGDREYENKSDIALSPMGHAAEYGASANNLDGSSYDLSAMPQVAHQDYYEGAYPQHAYSDHDHPAAYGDYYSGGYAPSPNDQYAQDPVMAIGDDKHAEPQLAPHEYYDSDPKQRNILRASTQLAPQQRQRQPQRAGESSEAGGSRSVPTNLSPEEMARLADLVASRMQRADPFEAPPVYH